MDHTEPLVSIVLPTFNSAKTIEKTIDSIINQDYKNWELLVINDFSSNDGTDIIVKNYSKKDPRIHLFQLTSRYGLAESLNYGIKNSNGKYIARADADDISFPDRLTLQVEIMERDNSIDICGGWQQHYGADGKWVHKPSYDPDYCKAFLIFSCDLCHSTLMLRKETFLKKNLFYDPKYQAEDFELWSRCIRCSIKITNVQKIIGDHEVGSGITSEKKEKMCVEHGHIVSNTLKNIFDIELSDSDKHLFDQWIYQFSTDRKYKLDRLKDILLSIYEKNKEVHFVDDNAMLDSITSEWNSAYYNRTSTEKIPFKAKNIKSVFKWYSAPSLYVRSRNFIGRALKLLKIM